MPQKKRQGVHDYPQSYTFSNIPGYPDPGKTLFATRKFPDFRVLLAESLKGFKKQKIIGFYKLIISYLPPSNQGILVSLWLL